MSHDQNPIETLNIRLRLTVKKAASLLLVSDRTAKRYMALLRKFKGYPKNYYLSIEEFKDFYHLD